MLKSQELSFALQVVKEASAVALRYFKQGVAAQLKADNTPVTAADKECENLIRKAIATKFPYDSILGEEEGETAGDLAYAKAAGYPRKRKWIIDPIDGTYNFIRQIPIFATLLALEENEEIKIGIISAPAMGEIYWAEKGGGAYKNGKKISVSKVSHLAQAQFVYGTPNRIVDNGMSEGLGRVLKSTYRQRSFGDYLNFALVLEGKAEAALEVGVKPWDLAPLKVLVEEAGGCYADLAGGTSIYTGSCLISNNFLHQAFLELLVAS